MGWGENNCGRKIDTAVVLDLFGGSYPTACGFAWDMVRFFRPSSPAHIQGFDGYDEPIGPTIECRLRALSPDEELASLRS